MRWLPLLALCLASVAGAEERWLDREPFSLAPRELLESSSPRRPDGVGLEVMLADYDYAVDAEHRRTRTLHRIARVLDTAGRDEAANLVELYYPWYEEAPEIRARVISPAGEVVWLDRPQREAEERISLMVESLGLKPGMAVADVGAGSGRISLMMAPLVGEQGKVYAVDISQKMLDYLSDKLNRQDVKNVELVLATAKSPELKPESVDLAQ